MKSELNSRQQLSILILMLLFHALFLIALFVIQQQHEAQERLFKKEPIILIKEEAASVPPPVVPQQLPPQKQQEWVAIESATPPAGAPSQQVEQPEIVEEQATAETAAEDTEKNTESIAADTINEAIEVAQQVLKIPQENTTVASSNPPAAVKASAPQSPKLPQSPVTPAASPRYNKVTFAQLAQGFAQHMEATMSVKSNKQGVASADQIKQIHYCQKILECVVNSYKINRPHLPHNKNMETTLVQLALNQDGSIYLLTMLKPSGNPPMDQFIIHMFKDASSSFPPLPTSFQKPYQLPVFSFDHIEVFQSSSYWHINNS